MGPCQVGITVLTNRRLEPTKSTRSVGTTNHISGSAGASWVLQVPHYALQQIGKSDLSDFPGVSRMLLPFLLMGSSE